MQLLKFLKSRMGHQRQQVRDAELTSRIAFLADFGFESHLLFATQKKPYEEALAAVVSRGADSVPLLLSQIGRSKYVALALGTISTVEALRALSDELRSTEWRRVEAAALALGLSDNPNAVTILEAARQSVFAQRIAEVSSAITKALAQIEARHQGPNWLKVDLNQPWDQIMLMQGKIREFSRDEELRKQAIEWWKHFVKAMPEMNLVIPGTSYTAEDVKGRAWSCLAVTIYYLLNPEDSVLSKPCPEARYCWEQALKLNPGDRYYESSARNVSRVSDTS